ncbi:MAG: hypothetical protein A2268_02765 [Candidatus Raymondbacteria bacterium RifOxyA12_full_50_37]|uniref:Flagellar protein FliL n=1 Tax=Candidatus Raymondbacteria bacterium RIFOXYD12_FULL_49_13 TaxID=1817890 RepID=A0A1F7F278_UNCRA|nr:MAG: hypothetical protein A2268_02765 [Candidatus Raymondbacteria bacterium RifOxyA12_full_50_37]OGJ85905.1 MAG: hypothetical protein A2248_15530 [Candidatus Raymondbacteria bacterium RIFOXYA2_FULL_49_16]OGJ95899.1 MAG: hypothetical protein A2453_01090 [Candidatus Raymondbacteria bacterium RIFOXYC2_FULL_50_21]OGJ99558.1 MAG: hypothetical protein A2487_01835 [Candidatus Raymondbacteria bacterium RifOxyC12_full_50_8]OGK00764.1 MAG: hypothetical protein A2519_14575 [Candidatus Raymondbacteria b
MAEEKNAQEKKEQAEEKPAAGAGKPNYIIMAAIIAGIVILQAIVVVVVINRLRPEDPEVVAERVKKQTEEQQREIETSMGATLESPIDVLVNLSGKDADRFLKAALVLEFEASAEGGGGHGEKEGGGGNPEVEKRLPKLRDIAIGILSSCEIDDIKDREGKKKICTRLKNEFNKVFPEPETIKNVYFSSFVFQ